MKLWWKGIAGRGNNEGKSLKAAGSLMSLEQLGWGEDSVFCSKCEGEAFGRFLVNGMG